MQADQSDNVTEVTHEQKQAAYREQRRQWALDHDNPYLEDGGSRGGRSGDAAPRVAQTKKGTNF